MLKRKLKIFFPLHIFQKFKNFWKLAHFGVFNILKPQNDIPIVSYDLKDENNALKRKLKKYFSKGPPFGYFQKNTKVAVEFLFLTLGSSPIA